MEFNSAFKVLNTTICHGIPSDVFLESYVCLYDSLSIIRVFLCYLLVLYITVYTELTI